LALLEDAKFQAAVSNIQPRADREANDQILSRTYVETGILPQLANSNNQILYGRRGTGKSHVLRVLGLKVEEQSPGTSLYIDLRVLGSAGLMTQVDRSLSDRCVAVFKDLLSLVQGQLMDIVTRPDRDGAGLQEVSELEDVIRRKSVAVATREVSERSASTGKNGLEVGLDSEFKASLKMADEASTEDERSVSHVEALRDTIVFAEVAQQLEIALDALGIENLYILIDEWSTIPSELQPYISEFLKRAFVPVRRVTVKIAALEYRSRFSIPNETGGVIGFELGPDISANLDLDDYYVYDRNPDRVVDLFLEVLIKHLEAELPDNFLASHNVTTAGGFQRNLFTERATFVELVRAGEGVVRDFIGVFTQAFFRAVREGKQKIDLNAVEEAARAWYETDKSTNLSAAQRRALHLIVTDVIGTRQAKMFMLAREHSDDPMVQSLFDLRLLHLVSRGYSDKENPGLRYNIYALDYGTYVDLKRTKREPESFSEVDLEAPSTEETERIVPFADKRSIRRIILDPSIFYQVASA
jgi:Cdc6-like AAA superfamily ATPase